MRHIPTKQKRFVKLVLHVTTLSLMVAVPVGACFARDALVATSHTAQQPPSSKCVLPASADVRPLEPRTVIERELVGGPTHYYEINVLSGQFLRVLVDQRGIDVAAMICTPEGIEGARVDRPNGASGPEYISLLAQQSGVFILHVKAVEKTALTARYAVRIEEQREPKEGDKTRIEAEQAVSEAEELRFRGKRDTLAHAIEKFQTAKTLWHSLGESYEEALALYGLGWSHSELGAHDMVKFPIPVHRLRWSYETRAEHERAIDCFESSLAIMTELANRYGQAIVYAGLAWPQMYLERNEEALQSFDKAYQVFRADGNVRGQAITLYGMGWIHAVRGEDQKALDSFLDSLTLRQTYNDLKGQAISLAGISRVQNRLGQNEEALSSAEKALTIFNQIRDTHGQASTYSILGWINHSLRRPEQAMGFFEKALLIRKGANDTTGEANSLYGMARVYEQQLKLPDALKRMQEVFAIIEPLRAKGSSSDLRTYYFAHVQQYYEFYVDLLMRLDLQNPVAGYGEKAVAAHERSKAREMLATLAGAGDISLSTSEDLSRPLEAGEIKNLLDDDTLLLEYALGEERSYVWAVSNKTVRGHQLPKRADVDAQAKKLYYLFTSRNQDKPGETSVQRRTRIQQADMQYTKEASALSRILLGPVASELGTKRLIIVAEGALQLIPFASLPAPPAPTKPGFRPLILDHEVVSLPSFSVLSALRREVLRRTPPPISLAVLADPVFALDDPRVRHPGASSAQTEARAATETARSVSTSASTKSKGAARELSAGRSVKRLLGTRWEGQQIAGLLPNDTRLLALDFQASKRRAVSGELADYRLIHFATHAFINDTDPVASTIVLSQVDQHGRPQDGLLTLHDIYNLKLRADLVVLSACRTALGNDIRGEGMRGLAGGFMQAKVPRIVVSLWPVTDNATAQFMIKFYRLMLTGHRKSAALALREVQIEMLKDERWQSPYFWAAFVIQGEWR
jgi:CHAT domain-containing protein/tetratricopeptide (TPR) repeat protein